MNPTTLATLSLVMLASVTDMLRRRIPNGLVLPFLAAGVIYNGMQHGLAGLVTSLGGIVMAAASLGILCWLRALGMGDLKLCAAVGAWVGFAQLTVALVMTAIAGAVIGIVWAARNGLVQDALEGAGDLLFSFPRRGFRPHETLALDNPRAHKMPYAPAIAIGTLFSFFC